MTEEEWGSSDVTDDYVESKSENERVKPDPNKRWYTIIVNEDDEYEVYSAVPGGPNGITPLDLLGVFPNGAEAADKIYDLQRLDSLLYPDRSFYGGCDDVD